MRTRKREKRAPMDTDSEDSWTPGSGHIQQRGAHAALRLSFPLAILQKEKEKGERRKEKRTPIPAMLTIPGPTQTRYFHFHKHQEWNTNTHHPKDSMMSALHHCRQRRSERSHHPSLHSNLSVSQGEMGRERQRDTGQGHTMLALSPHQQTNTEHQESPHSCNAVSLCPQPGETSARIPSSVASPFRSAHDVQRMREETDRSNTSRRHQATDRIFTQGCNDVRSSSCEEEARAGNPLSVTPSRSSVISQGRRGERGQGSSRQCTQYLLHRKKEPTHTTNVHA